MTRFSVVGAGEVDLEATGGRVGAMIGGARSLNFVIHSEQDRGVTSPCGEGCCRVHPHSGSTSAS